HPVPILAIQSHRGPAPFRSADPTPLSGRSSYQVNWPPPGTLGWPPLHRRRLEPERTSTARLVAGLFGLATDSGLVFFAAPAIAVVGGICAGDIRPRPNPHWWARRRPP